MGREHHYQATVTWTGNLGEGTSGYRSYSRDAEGSAEGKPMLPGSSDPVFRGDPQALESGGAAHRLAVSVPHAVVPAPVRGERHRGHLLQPTTLKAPWPRMRTAA